MWLRSRARADLPSYRVEDKSIAFAASVLTVDQRHQILREMAPVFNARHTLSPGPQGRRFGTTLGLSPSIPVRSNTSPRAR